ncbi:hypothetical protein QMY64_11600 [Phocaeicola dorei]|nr:hypothetical protein QMY64_11600 [Phocaeicola dorei]
MKKIKNLTKRIFNAKRIGTLAMLLFCGVAATYAQNAAGDYTAGTNALTTVTEENAFWINHTQIKYDKMNIKLKKTRYK